MKKIIAILLVVLFIFGCTTPQTPEKMVEKDDRVRVDYTISLENGTLLDTTSREVATNAKISVSHSFAPFTLIVGEYQFVRGFEDALIGMKENETKEITIPAALGYGIKNANLIMTFPVEQLDLTVKKEVGGIVYSGKMKGIITEINKDEVTVDFNHPLADKTLKASITVVEIKKDEN